MLTEIISTMGLGIGLYRYIQGQNHDRIRASSDTIEKFFKDENNRLAINILDWSNRKFKVPQYITKPPGFGEYLQHSYSKLALAFSMDSRYFDRTRGCLELKPELMDTEAPVYIEIFDLFFSDLACIQVLINNNIISFDEISLLRYWIWAVGSAEFEGVNIFESYLNHYNYDEIRRLVAEVNTKLFIRKRTTHDFAERRMTCYTTPCQ